MESPTAGPEGSAKTIAREPVSSGPLFSIRAEIPRATYRLQLTRDFTFRQAQALAPYFEALGIGACYTSPILRARAGSTHGYDICDPGQLNPELGSADDLAAFSRSLRERGIGLVVDIVPNHMGIGEPCNTWWMDVLENGPSSTFARYFDISWHPVKPELENKVLLPILEDQYGAVLETGALRLVYEDGAFRLAYHDRQLPIAPRTYSLILTSTLDRMAAAADEPDLETATAGDSSLAGAPQLELQSILTALGYLPPRTETDPNRIAERHRERQVIKRRLSDLYAASPEFRQALDDTLGALNGVPGDPRSFDRLDALINAQAYRLAFWRVASEEINYRRFFDINDMAAIRVELPEVFEMTHALILRLLAEGQMTGVRVDHPDGLWDPTEYFLKLQREYLVRVALREHPVLDPQELALSAQEAVAAAVSERAAAASPSPAMPLYAVAEKILSETEPLPHDWAVYGTTGYDFCNAVNSIFVDSHNEKAFNRIYSRFTGKTASYPEIVYEAKRTIMRGSLSSEVNSLAHQLERLAEKNRHYRDFTLNSMTVVLREMIAALGVYRTYIDVERGLVTPRDENYVRAAVGKAKRRNPGVPGSAFDFVRDTLLLRNWRDFHADDRAEVCDFIMRFQQVTSPVMAKGVEDTAFYIYCRLVSLNEVGGSPAQFGQPLAAFHRHNAARRREWPHTLLTTGTHDTKRSEDVRARINVLSEMPDEWRQILSRWHRMNQPKKTLLEGEPAPDANDEYLLYQTLIGAWPPDAGPDEFANYRERIVGYMLKATKEAKSHTSWISPNAEYDQAVEHFVRRLLPDRASDPFRASLAAFAERVAYFGRLNSLAQSLLKLTSPGVPDLYQGTELFDYSLVDPDNRRPVDYGRREQALAELHARVGAVGMDLTQVARELADDRTGRSKFYLIWRTLSWRRAHSEVLAEGSYRPLEARGEHARHVCAFGRISEQGAVLVVVPRLVVGLLGGEERPPLGESVWKDTRLLLPPELADSNYRDVLTGRTHSASREEGMAGLALALLLSDFPVALLERV